MSELGFGLMRLPLKDPSDQSSVDVPQLKEMVDMFLEAGLDYFDTAYMYHSSCSEKAIKEALVDRYPRDRYRIATKLPIMMIDSPEKAESVVFKRRDGERYIVNVGSVGYPRNDLCSTYAICDPEADEFTIRRLPFDFPNYISEMLKRNIGLPPWLYRVLLLAGGAGK